MRDSDFSSIDNYQSNQGMGSGDGIDSFSGGNTDDPVIGFGNDTYRQFTDDQLQNFLTPGAGSVNPYSSLNALNNFSGGAGDFGINGSRMGLNTALANLYTKERGASDINPFPEGPFGTDTIFGKVNFAKSLGKDRVREINDLKARQAFGLPSLKTGKDYTGQDYYDGQETIYGTAAPLPKGGLETFLTSLPGINAVQNLFGGGRNLPPNHPEMIRLRAEAEAEANKPGIIDQIGEGLSSYGTDVYNSFAETGDAISDFLTDITTKSNSYMDNKTSRKSLNSGIFSGKPQGPPPPDERIGTDLGDAFSSEVLPSDYRPAGVGIEQLGSMNPDGQYGDAAGTLFKRTNLDNYTSPNFTDKAIEAKYNEMFGPRKTAMTETSIPETINSVSRSSYPPGTTSDDLEPAAQAYLSLSRDDKMKMDFPTFYSQFKK